MGLQLVMLVLGLPGLGMGITSAINNISILEAGFVDVVELNY